MVAHPNPEIELEYKNAYTLLVAVVLSAQATDKQVNKITPAIFEEVSTPAEMLQLGESWLFEKISSINYNKTKAKNIIKLSSELIEKFSGEVPSAREDLESLAGVGRKSANVILNSIFKIPTIPVDTHVFRVSNRIGVVHESNVLKTEHALIKAIPVKYGLEAHHLFVLHGRYICKAIKPKCTSCNISHICKYDAKTS